MIPTGFSQVKMTTVEAKVIRKDGTIEDLGVVAFWHINPWRRLAWRLSQWSKGKRAGTATPTLKGN